MGKNSKTRPQSLQIRLVSRRCCLLNHRGNDFITIVNHYIGLSRHTDSQNFCTSVIEAQQHADSLILENGSPTLFKVVLDNLNIGFTAIFTVELLTNMCAHWFKQFVTNSWSVFDAFVVLVSLIALGPLDFPVSILRALRVVRLFGRLKASKKILAALSVSLVPMCNAFFIMLIVAMICESGTDKCGVAQSRLLPSVGLCALSLWGYPTPYVRTELFSER
jgi:hypothetical protein